MCGTCKITQTGITKKIHNDLQVSMDVDNKNGWRECFTVHGIKLPVGYFFGASAATGDLAGEFSDLIVLHA